MERLNLLDRTSVRGWLAGLTTALCLTLGGPSGAIAQVSENSKAKIAEAINSLNDLDTTKTINFDTARKGIEGSNSNAEVDFNSQTWDNLSSEEKKDSIWMILIKSDEMKSITREMLEDKKVTAAMKSFNEKDIGESFIEETDHDLKYRLIGLAGSYVIGFVFFIISSIFTKKSD